MFTVAKNTLMKRSTKNNISIRHAVLRTLKEFGANSAKLRQTRIREFWIEMLCRPHSTPQLKCMQF
jgi:hypothetical protein